MSDTRGHGFNIIPLLEHALKYSVLFGLAVTAISAATLLINLDTWGIPAGAVVSTSDILIGGLEAAAALLPIAAAVGIAIQWSKNVRELERFRRWWFACFFASLILSWAYFCWVMIPISFKGANSPVDSNWWAIIPLGIGVTWLFGLAVEDEVKIPKILVILGFTTVAGLMAQIAIRASDGDARLEVISGQSNCTPTEFVVWAGVDNLVTSCSLPPYRRNQQYFVRKRDDVSLKIKTQKYQIVR